MPTPSAKTTWSWQLLPSPVTMRAIRNCGRCLNRWCVKEGYGFRSGTSDQELMRIACARYLHLRLKPITLPLPYEGADPWPSVNLADLRDLIADLIDQTPTERGRWADGNGGGDSNVENWSLFSGYAALESFGNPFYLARVLLTLNNGWNFSAAQIDRLERQLGAHFSTEVGGIVPYHGPNTSPALPPPYSYDPEPVFLNQLFNDAPALITNLWEIPLMFDGRCHDATTYAALTTGRKWLCEATSLKINGVRNPSWHHGRDPYKTRRRHRRAHAIAQL